ncbi:hypothetical protein L1049_014955 [Liquidambar formosana]|uniref:SANT domain-containing protein n=1 Tax=Liquidambar formosana TaxID=63359 RepID=A0AAP0X261_LIQFO
MESNLDPFTDILPEPAVTNARAGGRFQPKAKPHPRKKAPVSEPSALSNATKEKTVTIAPTGSETTESIQPVDVADSRLTDLVGSSLSTSNLLGTKDSLKHIEDLSSEVPTSDDPSSSELVNPLSQLLVTREDLGSTDALPSEVPISDSNADQHSSLRTSAGEADSMGFDLDTFNDILPEPVTSNARTSGKFQPKAKPQPRKDESASVCSILHNVTKENLDTLASTGSGTTQSVKPVDFAENRLTDSVGSSLATFEIFGTREPLKDNEGSFFDDGGSLGLVDPSSQLCAMKEDVCFGDALHSVITISDGNGNWHDSFKKLTDSMGFDLDPFADVLPEPAISNARAGGKFQPKAKPHPRKETSASVTCAIPKATKEKLVELESADSHTTHSTQCVDVADNRLTDLVGSSLATSEIHGREEPLENNDGSFSGVPFSDYNGSLGLMNPSSDIVAADALHLEVAMADGNGDWHSSLHRSAGENADIFSGLDYFDDFLSQSTTTTESATNKSQPRVDTNALPGNKFLTSYPFDTDGAGSLCPSETPTLHASNNKDTEGEPGNPVLSSIDSLAFRECDASHVHPFPELSMAQDPVTCREADASNNEGDFQTDNGSLETEEARAFPGSDTLDIMSEAIVTSGQRTSKFIPKPKVQTQKEKPLASNSHPDAVESVMFPLDVQLAPSETEDMDEGSSPAFPSDDVLDFSSARFSDSIATDPSSELLVSKEPTNLVDTDAAIPGDAMHSEAAPEIPGKASAKSRKRKTSAVSDISWKPQKSSTAGEENEYGESSRQLRKRRAVHDLVNDSEDGTHDNGGFPTEPPSNSVIDEDENHDDEYKVENTSRKKRAPRKCKKPVAENEKPVRKSKKANEVPDQSTKEPPKKFSHSTRRNRRRVDKALLETPEDEIDLQKLPLKDLIQLAEFRERLSNKEATMSQTPLTNQSAENSFRGYAPNNEEEPFASEEDRGLNEDQPNIRVQQSSSNFNYHSYMNKTPSARWSKQDTELFYEAVQQFGTDFSMVQQLFPGRTRNQIKLKYKKEERQHPLRLSEAVKNRAKDHSHFEKVIERLQAAAQAEQDSNGDDSVGVTGEEEEEEVVEEVTPETNEAPKTEQNEEVMIEEPEANDTEVHSPVKSDDSDDDFLRWSQYKSEL